jgi:ribose transport system substrate-binding protein
MTLRQLLMAGAVAIALAAPAKAQSDITITLVPGLTTDDFYITMNRGAQAAAEALGITVNFQGAEEFEPVMQTPVLDAVIARQPDAILIAPTDSTQLIEPLRRAHDAGIPVVTVDTFIGSGVYQTGAGDADFPISYIASDNIEGGRIAARAMANAIGGEGQVYVSNVRPGISTTDQREEGFKLEIAENHPGVTVLDTQYNENDASLAASQFPGGPRQDARPCRRVRRQSLLGAGCRQRRPGRGQVRRGAGHRLRRAAIHRRQYRGWPGRHRHRPAPGEIGYYGVVTAYAYVTGQSVPPAIGTGFTVIDASNVGDPAIQRFIYSSD